MVIYMKKNAVVHSVVGRSIEKKGASVFCANSPKIEKQVKMSGRNIWFLTKKTWCSTMHRCSLT